MNDKLLTIVICTHNRAELLMQVIDSLNHVRRPEGYDISLLVIPNACTDETVSMLQQYLQRRRTDELALRYEEELQAGKSFALNHAIGMLQSGFLCFVDDDHRVDTGYFEAVVSGLERHSDSKIFCGQIIPDWTGEEPAWVHEQGEYKIFPLPVPHFELGSEERVVDLGSALPGGGNLVVRRSVFESVGLFSTELGPRGHNLAGSEDSDFVRRALMDGFTIHYLPEMKQYHYVDTDRLRFFYLVRKSFQRNRTITRVKEGGKTPPVYLWRRLVERLFLMLFSLTASRRRFYAMRTAGTLGEIVGYLQHKS
ncbi:MAG: glycosyltransferase [Chromatiales bacterium]|jgi:GT2 family glycosyltransferase